MGHDRTGILGGADHSGLHMDMAIHEGRGHVGTGKVEDLGLLADAVLCRMPFYPDIGDAALSDRDVGILQKLMGRHAHERGMPQNDIGRLLALCYPDERGVALPERMLREMVQHGRTPFLYAFPPV